MPFNSANRTRSQPLWEVNDLPWLATRGGSEKSQNVLLMLERVSSVHKNVGGALATPLRNSCQLASPVYRPTAF